ncbi:hypothetical protein D3C85_1639430 [compost metagenome]
MAGQELIAPGGGAVQSRVDPHQHIGVLAVVLEEPGRVDQLVVTIVAQPLGAFGKGEHVEKRGHLRVAVTAWHDVFPPD